MTIGSKMNAKKHAKDIEAQIEQHLQADFKRHVRRGVANHVLELEGRESCC